MKIDPEDASFARAYQEASEDDDVQENKKKKNSTANLATKIVAAVSNIGLFYSPDDGAFVSFENDQGYLETWRVKDSRVKNYIRRFYYKTHGVVVSDSALKDALGILESMAEIEGERMLLNVRMAKHKDRIYLDLANDKWQVVEITPHGWEVISSKECPVKFRRTNSSYPIPTPVKGGSINELREFINVKNNRDFVLLVTFLLNALHPGIPYFVLALHGDHGSAKSTAEWCCKVLLDPCKGPIRAEPKGKVDLIIAACNSWIIALDNLSYLPKWLSDALCRLATGGGLGKRTLYSDDGETILDAMRPVILNGITEIVVFPDLLDRSIILYLPAIPDKERKPVEEVKKSFDEARPRILGALLDGVSCALRNVNAIQLSEKPRMADSARWATAAEEAFGWSPGAVMEAYVDLRAELNNLALDVSVVYAPLCQFIESRLAWEGTAKELLALLNVEADQSLTHRKDWPRSPRKLSGNLRTIAANLRKDGIEIQFDKKSSDKHSRRLITISLINDPIDRTGRASDFGQSDGSDDQTETQGILDMNINHGSQAYV